jgi:ribosomal protein S18 acetylase RimI-like enzyme
MISFSVKAASLVIESSFTGEPMDLSTAKIELSQKPVLPEHFEELITFDTQTLILNSDIPSNDAPPPFTFQEINSAFERGDGIYWLTSFNHQRIGYYWIEYRSDSLFLSGLAIATPFRNKKIGSQVLSWLDQVVEDKGLSSISLAVVPLNYPAIHTYLKHGYQVVRCESDYFGDTCPNKFRLIMEKRRNSLFQFNHLSNSLRISCKNETQMTKASRDGYVGVALEWEPTPHDHKEGILVFKKPNDDFSLKYSVSSSLFDFQDL